MLGLRHSLGCRCDYCGFGRACRRRCEGRRIGGCRVVVARRDLGPTDRVVEVVARRRIVEARLARGRGIVVAAAAVVEVALAGRGVGPTAAAVAGLDRVD